VITAPDERVSAGRRPVVKPPREVEVRIGARLPSARQARGLTIENVAGVTRLSWRFISRFEREEVSASVASWWRCATHSASAQASCSTPDNVPREEG
jgi:predicted transcriptional regulator